MGGFASRPGSCACLFSSSNKKKNGKQRRRRRITRRRTISRRVSSLKTDKLNVSGQPDRSYSNPAFQGTMDGAWSDAISVLESEFDDEFYSVYDDVVSVTEPENASVSSPRDSNNVQFKANDSRVDDQVTPVYAKEVSNVSVGGQEENNHSGILPNNCLPFLASSAASIDKKRPLSPGTPSSKRKPSRKFSFKWREGNVTNPTLVSSKALVQRPIAGSSIPCCPTDKKMTGCWWSPIEPSTFKVRGRNYYRDKKKDCASNCAAFYPFGADIFLSPRKIHHVARFVELPHINTSDEVPGVLVVNVQIPLYPATIFQSENDGDGMNLVMYFKRSESYSKELPPHFQENISVRWEASSPLCFLVFFFSFPSLSKKSLHNATALHGSLRKVFVCVDQFVDHFHELTIYSKIAETEQQTLAQYRTDLRNELHRETWIARLINVEEAYQLALCIERQIGPTTGRKVMSTDARQERATLTPFQRTLDLKDQFRSLGSWALKGTTRVPNDGTQCYKCEGFGHYTVVCSTRDKKLAFICEKELLVMDVDEDTEKEESNKDIHN